MNAPIHPTIFQSLSGHIPTVLFEKPAFEQPNEQTVVHGKHYPYQHTTEDDLVIDCHLEYEKAFDGGTGPNSEESYPARIDLIYALVNGVDVRWVLSDDAIKKIEEEALCSMAMDKWNSDYDKGEERALDREAA